MIKVTGATCHGKTDLLTMGKKMTNREKILEIIAGLSDDDLAEVLDNANVVFLDRLFCKNEYNSDGSVRAERCLLVQTCRECIGGWLKESAD